MDTDDEGKDSLEAAVNVDTDEKAPSAGESLAGDTVVGVRQQTEILRAEGEGYWAELEVVYILYADRPRMSVSLTRYRTKYGANSSGVLQFSLNYQEDVGYKTLGAGRQDGQWHSLDYTADIETNLYYAYLNFKFLFFVGWSIPLQTSRLVHFIPRPPIINPMSNFISSSFRLTGVGAGIGTTLTVYRSFDYVKTLATTYLDGGWVADLVVPDSITQMSVNADQSHGTATSGPSNALNLYRAKLTSPTNNSVMPAKDFKFTGIAAPNTSVRVVQGGTGTAWSGTVNTGGTSSWQAPPLPAFSGSGEKYITAELGGIQSYTEHLTFRYLDYPVITTPSSTVPLGFTLAGRNRLSGATVSAYLGPSNTAVGSTGAATTDTFSLTITGLDPGAHALTVEQFHSGKASGRSSAVTFNVRPDPPRVNVDTLPERVRLYGTGFRGGEVHFHQHGNGDTPLFSVPIKSNHSFDYDVPPTQLPGAIHYSCRQSVAGVGTARIYSDGWVQVQAIVPTPAPTQLTSSRDGQKLVISGRGLRWGTTAGIVVIFNNGQDMRPGVPDARVQDNLAWSTRSTADIAPGNYTGLTAKMWVNDLYSQPVTIPAVIIPSPPPVLTPITAPTDQRPRISGTMWTGSRVEVRINGGPVQIAITTGASFYLNAGSDWEPGAYTVSVTAEFGGQKSNPATQSLTVRTPQPKILTSGTVPLQAIINGEGWPGCRVRIFTTVGNQELGADNVKPDGKFEIALLRQAAGEQTLYAVQYESGNPANASVESSRVLVRFGVPIADVTVPGEGGTTVRVSTFSGTTNAVSGTVELWLGNKLLRNNIAINSGTWSAPGIELDAGSRAVLVYIRDGGELSPATTRNVKVVPEKLKIDSPLTGQNIGRQIRVSGVGAFPGDQVIVRRSGAPLDFPPVTVNQQGYWTTNVQHTRVAGTTFAAIAQAGAGLESEVSDPITPKLLHAPGHIIQPEEGDRTGTMPVFAGLARPFATVTIAPWFNNATVLATTTADNAGDWIVQSTVALAEGGARVQVRDTVLSQHSEWLMSERFEVKAAVADFAESVVLYPREGQEVSRQPPLSGIGLPGATVRVYARGAASDVLGEFLVARDGTWSGTLNKQLPLGNFVCSVRQQRDGKDSNWMVPERTFKVIQLQDYFEGPVITLPVSDPVTEIEPMPELRGTGFPGALLTVYLRSPTTEIAETTVQANGHWVTRCKSYLEPGSREMVAIQKIDGATSFSDIRVNIKVGSKPYSPLITSFAEGAEVSRTLVVKGNAMPGATITLYPHGSATAIGTAVANAAGLWWMKLYDLPGSEYTFAGSAAYKGVISERMSPIRVYVHDFG